MNKLFSALILFMITLSWVSCHKELDVKDPVVSNDEMAVSGAQARFSWCVDFTGSFQTGVELSPNENMTELRRVEATKEGDKYVAVVDGLSMGTTYYYRIVVWNKLNNYEQEMKSFATSPAFTITLACNPEEGGKTIGGGTYIVGDTCTVIATANIGYNFVNWTENESQVSMDSIYAFAVTGDRTLVANFQAQPQPQSFTISVSANPSNGGTVTGGGTFPNGESCTVIATAAEGYTFDNWTENGDVVSENANYTFTVTNDRTLVANFSVQAPNTYNINVSPNPSNGGTVTGGGSYNQGASCTVTATVNTGYTFSNWTENGNVVSENANYTFTVTSNRTLVANFQQQYTITATSNPTNGGAIFGNQSPYTYGQTCNLTAMQGVGYIFTNWTENGNEIQGIGAFYSFPVTENRILVANFTQTYTISISANPNNGGTVSGDGTFPHGESCTVIATAAEGYTFTNWTENGDVVSDNANYTFTITNDRTLVANFSVQAPNTYNINVSPNPSNGGTVTGGGSYNQGASCTVTATANTGYTFTNWTENGNVVSSNANYTFTVTGNRTLVANFQLQSYTISVSANPSNDGTVSGGGQYNYGQSCAVTATANTGYTFTNWTEGGNVVSSNANYTFTVTNNRTLVANFTQQYTINVSADPTNGGTVTGGGQYNYGQSCTVTATANTGYTFTNWTENGNVVSSSANYTFTVTSNRTLVANFQLQSYTISVSANPSNGGTVSDGGHYDYGQSCTVTATPADGYTFKMWTENGCQVSTNANYTFSVTGNRTLVAQFQAQGYTISISANPTSGGSVTGGGTYFYGASCTVTATANTDYTFTNWTEDGNVVSTNANYTFTVTGNSTLVANFTYTPPTYYTISVSSNPSNGGLVHVGSTTGPTTGTYTSGQSCTVYAVANSNYTFTNWKENGNVVSNNANFTFTVTNNHTLVANFSTAPQGAIDGKFTINSSGDKVYFSKGNLQYIGSAATPYWKFADNQWDVLGITTGQNSTSQTVDRDLFGWGTSGYDHGAMCYQPWSTSESNDDYNVYGNIYYNLYNQTGQADWGYNVIFNGGNAENSGWRTFTNVEWDYVFNTRSAATLNNTTNARYAKATVNGVSGIVLFPDNYTHPSVAVVPNNINVSEAPFTSNDWSGLAWTMMEEAGAVFLPTAGGRHGTSVFNVVSSGLYWSASQYNGWYAYSVKFSASLLNPQYTSGSTRSSGFSVRLVRSAQ